MHNTTAALNRTSQTGPNEFITPKINTRTEKTRDPVEGEKRSRWCMAEATAGVDSGHLYDAWTVEKVVIDVLSVLLRPEGRTRRCPRGCRGELEN
jgi:hypothetical protein